MIKGITVLHSAASSAANDKLTSFFSGLGFESGKEGPISGPSFLAPTGNLQFADGSQSPKSGIQVEVTELDAVYSSVQQWLSSTWGEATGRITPVSEAEKIRSFEAEPVPGLRIAFWEWTDILQGKPVAIEGDLSAADMRFAIVVARWNAVITDRLLQGSLDALCRSGAVKSDIQIVRVPGAWEIPSAARALAEKKQYDAIITLGCLLRGETAHYEAIYNEVSRGIGQSQQETGIPHSFGVLTCETLEQALNRAGIKAGNKGFEAAVAAIEMVSLHRKLGKPAGGVA